MVYRILSPTAILGYGFPEPSFKKALEYDLDLIAVDAGSMDAGPYYLGANAQYVGKSALKRDLELLIKGAIQSDCPLIIGSAGFSGGDVQLRKTVEIIKEIIGNVDPEELRLAVIPAGVPHHLLEAAIEQLIPLGEMPTLTAEIVKESEVVGQMGIEPIVTALEKGARVIVCGRAYDPAVFSADPIRKGYPKGACLHAAKILECGAIACEPGSGSDCLIAEISKDGTATFFPTNDKRAATINSIAAHTLYEKSKPDVFALPGGLLSIQNTSFSQIDEKTASFKGSEFQSGPLSIKLEGSRSLGKRIVSIIPLEKDHEADPSVLVYGRNGVEASYAESPVNEIGLIVVAKSETRQFAKDALTFLRSTLLHFGYEGRISTAGNLAFPFSPGDFHIVNEDGSFSTLFIAGSRDPIFQEQLPSIEQAVMDALINQHPHLNESTAVDFTIADADNPIAVLETVGETVSDAQRLHEQKEAPLRDWIDHHRPSFLSIGTGDAFTWSIHHLLHDRELIEQLFPIEVSDFARGRWSKNKIYSADYGPIGCGEARVQINESLNELSEGPPGKCERAGSISLKEIAKVIRSKNAGINEITFDIIFKKETDYNLAIQSNLFCSHSVSEIMDVDPNEVLGCYRYDQVLAIKFTLRRRSLCGSPGERDTFGAQQHSRLLSLLLF